MANNLNTTKEQERAELHRAIWQIANDLRGSVDGWDFKQYVLGILFYRFVSENLTNYISHPALLTLACVTFFIYDENFRGASLSTPGEFCCKVMARMRR